jgi:hypothetical protein
MDPAPSRLRVANFFSNRFRGKLIKAVRRGRKRGERHGNTCSLDTSLSSAGGTLGVFSGWDVHSCANSRHRLGHALALQKGGLHIKHFPRAHSQATFWCPNRT